MAWNDGAFGQGRLEFYTGKNVIGPNRVGSVDHLGRWALGNGGPNALSRLYLESPDHTPDGSMYLLSASIAGGNALFYWDDRGYLSLGNHSAPPAPLCVGNYVDFQVDTNGKFKRYGNVAPVKGQLMAGNASTGYFEILSVGTNGQVLTADSTVNNGVKWADAGSGGVSGLTTGKIPKATSSTSVADSLICVSSGAISIAGATASYGFTAANSNSSGNGLLVSGGNTASEYALRVMNSAQSVELFSVKGNGAITFGGAL
jgi:hypothetical protein